MKLFIKSVKGLTLPSRAKENDAAYDVVATSEPNIVGTKRDRPLDGLPMWSRIAYIEYGTNLFVAPEHETEKIVDSFRVDATGAFCDVIWKHIGIDFHTELWPRSSVSNKNLVLANSIGLVDNGYRNEVKVRFKYLFQPEDMLVFNEGGTWRTYGVVNPDHLYNLGDKIIQLQASVNVCIDFQTVDKLPASQRDLGGFGSSGK